jgi:hypothetical protein
VLGNWKTINILQIEKSTVGYYDGMNVATQVIYNKVFYIKQFKMFKFWTIVFALSAGGMSSCP